MRTEGVIKVVFMMIEERIFDFDRRCGSRAERSLLHLGLCKPFTLSLFTKRDRVAARPLPIPVFLSPALIHSGSKFTFLSYQTRIGG